MSNKAPKIITRRQAIATVAARFEKQYALRMMETGSRKDRKPWGEIHAELKKLDPKTATEQDVADIIGNTSWTELTCDQCKQPADAIARFTSPDATTDICKACIDKTKAAFTTTEQAT